MSETKRIRRSPLHPRATILGRGTVQPGDAVELPVDMADELLARPNGGWEEPGAEIDTAVKRARSPVKEERDA